MATNGTPMFEIYYIGININNKLDLRKTSSESGVARRDVKFHFSDGKVSIDTLTAENEILRSTGAPELAGILRKSSKDVVLLV